MAPGRTIAPDRGHIFIEVVNSLILLAKGIIISGTQ